MKTGHKVSLLVIDEAQDLRTTRMQIVVNLARKCKDLDIYIAGDLLQTLFSERVASLSEVGPTDAYAMNVFRRVEAAEMFDLSINFRCSKAHVDFNNHIMKTIPEKHNFPNMACDPNNSDMDNKPVLFTYPKASSNAQARDTAEIITDMIEIIMRHDASVMPGDTAIIMAKSNENNIYLQLNHTLSELYETMGFGPDRVGYMFTRGAGVHIMLDWEENESKTKLLSIHGDKGKA